MNGKSIAMIIKETKMNLAKVCNESGLPPIILDLIVQGIYSEIHSLAESQIMEEESIYAKMLDEDSKKIKVADENV